MDADMLNQVVCSLQKAKKALGKEMGKVAKNRDPGSL
jgi:hypothetical protein